MDPPWTNVPSRSSRRPVDYNSIAPSHAQSRYPGASRVPPSGYGGTHAPATRAPGAMREHRIEDFDIGTIIVAPMHQQDSCSTTDRADPCLTVSNFGDIYSKCRKMVVVATFYNHYIAVPVFSHEGSGLQRKPHKDEFVSIRDHRSSRPFEALSHHKPLVTEFLRPEADRYYPESVVHLTLPQSRNYKAKCIIEGRLDGVSTNRLIRLYWSFSPR